jgi:glycosyltransferase involved in cell wall biosynthesis
MLWLLQAFAFWAKIFIAREHVNEAELQVEALMVEGLSYWVVVVARNAAQHLPNTLDSLLRQNTPPKRLTVVDDGSTDETGMILRDYESRTPTIDVLSLPDRGYDIRRVPSNINLACKLNKEAGLRTDFFMISGDDSFYPTNYVEMLISRMQSNQRLVIASGHASAIGTFIRERAPSGSGRMIKCWFWDDVGGRYPSKAGWETWLLYTAAMKGYEVRLFDDMHFQHVRPRGKEHQFGYWGAAMGTLGYHPLYAVGRIAKNALGRSIGVKGSVNILRGYLQSQLGSEDPFISPFDEGIRRFVMTEQSRRIQMITATIL